MAENPIKRVNLHFPEGITAEMGDDIGRFVQDNFPLRCSCGGMKMTYMPQTKEEEGKRWCEFADDTMEYVYNTDRGRA